MLQEANRNGSKTRLILNEERKSHPYNLQPLLQKLTCKMLIIHGDADPIPLSTAQNTHHSIPNSQLVVIKNCGHFPSVKAPEELFSAVETFFKNTDQK